jgi:hypothetical protein
MANPYKVGIELAMASNHAQVLGALSPRFNLLSAQLNEFHACAVEAVKRDPSLNI